MNQSELRASFSLAAVFALDLDLDTLEEAGNALVKQANAAMEERTEFRDHVRQLETQFDARSAPLAPGEVQREAARRAQSLTTAGP